MTAASAIGTPATDRQLEILNWMREYIHEHGMPPTMREIGNALGISSTNGVSEHLHAMKKKGLLKHSPGRARAWRPTNIEVTEDVDD